MTVAGSKVRFGRDAVSAKLQVLEVELAGDAESTVG